MKPAKSGPRRDFFDEPMDTPRPMKKDRTVGFLVKPSREDRRLKRTWKRGRR